jgi:hypothetical protein
MMRNYIQLTVILYFILVHQDKCHNKISMLSDRPHPFKNKQLYFLQPLSCEHMKLL